ncbi:Epsin-2 [Porphyridium purpureum]|uniref:Epsin-2 n=1 Tax=Porphyridium purpureum TaxID=35688 RepID=A0A5J4YN92_PORPP|nr:Epsin-2 [Porphyridium purpureum]|eukprot:POR7939..scf244_11
MSKIDWKGWKRSAINVRKSAASGMKNLVMTDVENLTRSATADTSWGASGTELDEIARATYNREDYPLIMGIVWQRLTSRRWRCVYKGLELLKHLLFYGSARCLDEARDARYHIQALEGFRFIDPRNGKDEGQNVRTKAKEVFELIENPKKLEEEREKSKALKSKIGITPTSGSDYYSGSSDYYSQQTGSRSGAGAGHYGGHGSGDPSSYTYNYDEELDGPRPGSTGADPNAGTQIAISEPEVEEPVQMDDLLGFSDDVVRPSGPTIEYNDDDDDISFNPRALPAPEVLAATQDPLGDLFAPLSITSGAPAVSVSGKGTPNQASSSKSADIFAGLAVSDGALRVSSQANSKSMDPFQAPSSGRGSSEAFGTGAMSHGFEGFDGGATSATSSQGKMPKSTSGKKAIGTTSEEMFAGLVDFGSMKEAPKVSKKVEQDDDVPHVGRLVLASMLFPRSLTVPPAITDFSHGLGSKVVLVGGVGGFCIWARAQGTLVKRLVGREGEDASVGLTADRRERAWWLFDAGFTTRTQVQRAADINKQPFSFKLTAHLAFGGVVWTRSAPPKARARLCFSAAPV